MKTFITKFFENRDFIYKTILFLFTTFIIVSLLPKEEKFPFAYKIGMPWVYDDYYAPFDFSLPRPESDVASAKKQIMFNHPLYLSFAQEVNDSLEMQFKDQTAQIKNFLLRYRLRGAFDSIMRLYNQGVLAPNEAMRGNRELYIRKSGVIEKATFENFHFFAGVQDKISQSVLDSLKLSWRPNIRPDTELTNRMKEKALREIPLWEGFYEKGSLILSKNQVVDKDKFRQLETIKNNLSLELSSTRYFTLFAGYLLTVGLVIGMLFLFIQKYRPEIYTSNRKLVFVLLNLVLMVLAVTAVLKWQPQFLYLTPLCLLPLVVKAFFDARLGLFTHVITVLILSLVVSDSIQFLVIQFIAGIVTILTVSESYKRTNLFISVGKIVAVYLVSFVALELVFQGSVSENVWQDMGVFGINGLLILALSVPLFYVYEKVFGLVSDYSLLELSDTNTDLLKEMADKAPGTFHHSLQVANLAEAAAQEVGANAMLVRVGALYHDIGKMLNPIYFTENQISGSNLHDELSSKESVKIIIDHVKDGVALAKKNKLPDRIIDFIRTHHGTTLVYYFYKKEKEQSVDVDEKQFRYPGPIPFSKETAILMMADSVEAASKSLKEPTALIIDDFVEKIITKQLEEAQFVNADISLKEIEQIKKVLKRKLINIYHLRVAYPE
ncbi:MAG: HDIG domain-containing protein [Bacteroidetes bacterium]|nr:HDIG domain-containing protein [Bacteroidota bacterium]